jgi:hypothetical protein
VRGQVEAVLEVREVESFDEFLEKRFPESRRKAYNLMAIHENLMRVPKQQLREVGWSKAVELVRVARKDGEDFDCATWLHKARELPKEDFKGEVERHLTGKETESWKLIYFKLYKSQLPVVEKALETAGLMLGTDKSRGYCLEMICADFWRGPTWPRLSRRFDYAGLTGCNASSPETTSAQTGPERICVRPGTGASTRLLAVPRVRFHGKLGGPSHQT